MSERDDNALASALESILLIAGGNVTVSALASTVHETRSRVEECLGVLSCRLCHGIRLQTHHGSVQLVTAPENVEVVQRFLGTTKPPPLSRAAIETLSVVAYRQPVTRAEIEALRGVNSDRAVLTLVSRDLIAERGQRPVLGRPMEYGTTLAFLQYFGLASLDDLPALAPDPRADMRAEPQSLGFRRELKKKTVQPID